MDDYLKKENKRLKENSERLQEEFDEASTNLKKVLHLVNFTKVIRRELKEDASSVKFLELDNR